MSIQFFYIIYWIVPDKILLMKNRLNLTSFSQGLVTCLAGTLLAHASANASLVVTKGDGTGEIRITATNPSDNACGAEIDLGDGKTHKRRLEAKEQWQLQHVFNADGNFKVNLSGVFVTRGLRSVTACDLKQDVVVNVSGGQATVSTQTTNSAAAPAATPATQATAATKPQSAPSPGESADLLLFYRKDSDKFRFITTIDGTRKLDSVDRLLSGYQLCYILQPDAYRGLGGPEAQRSLNNEVSRTVNALAGNRQIRNTLMECVRNGQFVGASYADVVAVQRRIVPDLKAVREFAGFEPFSEVKYDTLAQAVSRRQQAAAQRNQDVATWTTEINTLSEVNSLDKVGSITLSAPRGERESIKACTLEYSGTQGQAVVAYGNNLIGYTSPTFRTQVSDLRATFNAHQPYANVYKSIDNFYVDYQKDPTKCNIFVDFPKNLKTLISAMERDRKGVPFDINNLVSTMELREAWAKKQGYENLAASEFASQIRGNAESLKNLAEKGIRDKPEFDRNVLEMRTAKYSDNSTVEDVLTYLNDKAAAAQKRGATALSIRDERATAQRVEAERRNQEEQRRRAAYAKEFPYTATINCGMNGRHINIMACMSGSGSLKSQLELTNGSEYKMFQAWDVAQQAGRETSEGVVIPLRSSFKIKVQNVNETLILTVKVVNNATGIETFTKSAARFGVVYVGN